MPIFKFLHIATMFMAVGVSVGADFVLHWIASSGDVRAIRTSFNRSQILAKIVPSLYLLGAAFGLLAVYFDNLDFLRPWLITTYLLFIIANVLGARSGTWHEHMLKAAMTSSEDSSSAEFKALVEDKSSVYQMWVFLAVILAIIFVMVFKPGGI